MILLSLSFFCAHISSDSIIENNSSTETSPPKKDLKNTLIQALKMERKPASVEDNVKLEPTGSAVDPSNESTNIQSEAKAEERKRRINFPPDDGLISDIFHYNTKFTKSDQPPSRVVEQMSMNKMRVCLLLS